MKNSAVLLVSCPDKKGIVASISDFIFKNNGNILESDQYQDNEIGFFLMRLEWDLANFKIDINNFEKYFNPVAGKFKMDWKAALSSYKPKVAIFTSKEDHCLSDLLYRYKNEELNCEISLIISNHQNTKPLAEFYKIPFYHVPVDSSRLRSNNKLEIEKKQLKILKDNNVDLVVLARYMQVLSPQFIKNYKNRIINIHHSFLPAFVGARPYHQAFKRGVKIIGATSHFVNEELDNGPIIEQDVIRITHRDSVSDLIMKGKDLEKMVLSRAVKWHIENRILFYGNKTVVFE